MVLFTGGLAMSMDWLRVTHIQEGGGWALDPEPVPSYIPPASCLPSLTRLCSLPPARSSRAAPVKKWEADRIRSLFTSHAACFLKSQAACNFLSCRFPTRRTLDAAVGALPAEPAEARAPGGTLRGGSRQRGFD